MVVLRFRQRNSTAASTSAGILESHDPLYESIFAFSNILIFSAIPGDVAVETHSAWTLELVGVSGTTCTLKLARPSQMAWVARSVRVSLRPAANRRTTHL